MGVSSLQALVLCTLAALGLDPCGADSGPAADARAPDSRPVDRGPCDGGAYPCGPYGGDRGDVVADAIFSAYLDPGHLCKANTALKPDLTALRPVALSHWHRGDASCPEKRRRLLWINLSAGWCPSCANEVSKLQARFVQGKLDPRVAVLDVVLETKTRGQPATAAFLQTWIKANGLTFAAALDPGAAMKRYLSANDLPAAMLVDLQDMTLVYKATGAQTATVEQEAITYLQ